MGRRISGSVVPKIHTLFSAGISRIFVRIRIFVFVTVNLGDRAGIAVADNFDGDIAQCRLFITFSIVSFENHISPARQMLTGDTSRPPPLRYLRTCAKVDNTNATAASSRSKDQGCSCSNASSLLIAGFLSSLCDTRRDDEVTSALSSPRTRLEAESGSLSSITWMPRYSRGQRRIGR